MGKNYCEMAIEILQKTEDGNKLAPLDLQLLQDTVNNWLNEAGEIAFCEMHSRVMAGIYQPPWLHGVEHLTRNHEGYVLWKGDEIEHWSGDLPYSAEGMVAAKELARRCVVLERTGEKINTNTVVWNWED